MEWLIAVGLGIAAGTNAYIPLLLTGGLAKWTGVVTLPDAWSWLESEWTLGMLAALIVLEFVTQRFPGLATVSDVFQTALRPTAAGIAVSAQGAGAATVTDWDTFWSDGQWVPVVVAVAIALGVHLLKVVVRATADAMSAGVASGVLPSIDEGSSVMFTVVALLIPILVPLLVVAAGVILWVIIRRRTRRRQSKAELLND